MITDEFKNVFRCKFSKNSENYKIKICYLENSASDGSMWSQSSLVDDNGKELQPQKSKDYSIEKKTQILKLIESHPNWSESTIQARGGKEYKKQYKKRWEEQVRQGGTKFEKYKFIDEHTYEAFTEARKQLLSVRDTNIRDWALQARQTFQDDNFHFKASARWIEYFKERHAITSRKITKLVSRHEHRSFDEILKSAKSFQENVRQTSLDFKPENVLNTDQVGFTYEMISNRKLSHRGEKITSALAKSPTNLATHSYTIQYVISKAGKIVGDVFLCLQEQSGKLGA